MSRACSTNGGIDRKARRKKIMLKLILKRQDGIRWIGLIWLRIGTSGGLF
jgi:hypothetical protein